MAGAPPGHYHILQTGDLRSGRYAGDPSGHAGPHGFFRGDGTHAVRAGLCHPGHLRAGRRAGPHGDPVDAAEPLQYPHVCVGQQDGPGGKNGACEGRRAEDPAGKAVRPLHRLGEPGCRGSNGADGRGGAGRVSAEQCAVAEDEEPSDRAAKSVPLLVRLRFKAGGRAGIPGRHGALPGGKAVAFGHPG